jgi:hypothetical protein
MATGKNNAAAARALFLSERAIEKHIDAVSPGVAALHRIPAGIDDHDLAE